MMAVAEAEAWGIFANVVAGPLSTIVAAVITSVGTVTSVVILTDAMKATLDQTLVQQRAIEKMMVERIPVTKFF